MTTIYWISFTALIAPTTIALGWLIFRSWEGFIDAIWFELMPDIISLLRGQLKRDWIAEIKLSFFVIGSLIAGAFEKQLIDYIFSKFS